MRVEDLTKFEGECPNIVVFGTYMDIRVPLTRDGRIYRNILLEFLSRNTFSYHFLITYLMKTQEEYAHEIDEIVRRDVESCQSDWFIIDREIFMQPENKNKTFILGTRKTGCDIIVLGGTNCGGSDMDWLFGCLGNENFYVCQPVSFYKSQQEIQKVNPLYAFKVATAYFREQGKVPVFEDSNCRLIKL